MTEFMVGLLSPLQSPLWVAPFPSSHRPPRASYFSIIAIFIGKTNAHIMGTFAEETG